MLMMPSELHRAHASTALIADHFDTNNKMFGYLMEKEVNAIEKIMKDTARPFTAIMVVLRFLPKLKSLRIYWEKLDNRSLQAA